MSLFKKTRVTCPSCSAEVPFDAVHSVNVDRRPGLRDQILAESFQQQTCPSCGVDFRFDPEFHYVDTGRHQWVAALPLAKLSHWRDETLRARDLFERVYGAAASPHTREVGAQLRPRVSFGWAALREKVVAAEHKLDDVTLELCKAAVLRDSEESPLSADTELRLVDANADHLLMAWVQTVDETVGDMLRVPRSTYDEIAADPDGVWRPLREELSQSLFVDLNRLMMDG